MTLPKACAWPVLIALLVILPGCKRAVFPEPYARQKVHVQFGDGDSGGGGDIDTDIGISSRQLTSSGSDGEKSTQFYRIENVTPAGYTLVYEISLTPPKSLTVEGYRGRIELPYGQKRSVQLLPHHALTVESK